MKYLNKSILLNLVLIGIAVIISYHAARMVRNVFMARTESLHITEKINDLEKKKKDLEAKIAELQVPEAIEREAKQRLNLKKPGEEVVVVVPEKSHDQIATSSPHWWQKITSLFQ